MLKLEKLEIRGFKSFCEPTEVDLTNAITAVVGPNGCGKSNLADAITWVLGEQSARLLRGGRMEDVIFQGSRSRQPVGFAEVILRMVATKEISTTNGNGDRTLSDESAPAESIEPKSAGLNGFSLTIAPGEALTVARRLFRSGESEYLLNGRRVRLRDIFDLFAGTGLGPGHYAIIGQGHVSEIVTAKPSERRAVIESAAGITRFRLRQRSIELRLESAKQNLVRINDLVGELERQVRSLTRQGAKARRYRRLKEELRGLLRVFLAAEFRRVESELEEIGRRSQREGTRRAEIEADIAHLESEYRSTMEGMRKCESALSLARDRLAELDVQLERTRNHRSNAEMRLGTLESRRAELQREAAALRERLQVIDKEIARTSSGLIALTQEIEISQQGLEQQEVAHRTDVDGVNQVEGALNELRQKLLEETNNTANLRNARRQIEDSLDRVDQQLKKLSGERERTLARRAELENQHALLSEEIGQDRTRVDALTEQAAQLSAALKQAQAAKLAQARELAALERELLASDERLASLVELDQRHAYYSQAVQHLFEHAAQSNRFQLLGTLADFMHVSREQERLVETLLGDRLQIILVPTLDDARQAIRFLEETQSGRATFLVAKPNGDGARSTTEKALTTRTLLGTLGLQPTIAEPFAQVFPELANIQLAADLDTAITHSLQDQAITFASPTGGWARAGQLLAGGSDENGARGLLALKRQINELRDRVGQLREATETARQHLLTTERLIEEREQSLDQLNAQLREEEKLGLEKSHQLIEIEKEILRADQHLRVIEVEWGEAEKDRTDLLTKQERLTEILEQAQKQLDDLETRGQQVQAELAERRAALDQLSQTLSSRRAETATRIERQRAVEAEVRRLKAEKARTQEQLDGNGFEIARLENEATELRSAIIELDRAKDSLDNERQEAEARVHRITGELEQSHSQTDDLSAQIDELRLREREVREQIAQVEVRRAELISESKHIAELCLSELAQSIEEVLRLTSSGEKIVQTMVDLNDIQSVRSRVEELRRRIEQIGPVNMMALEELDAEQQRLEFLSNQRQDIQTSIASTERALAEIKRRTRQRFLETFQAINANFSESFQELFGGGQGRMVLLDEENPLESGIEIIAQPPGKRLQNIMLLSGGEKAMTAIALLLAIFRFRPSPFCVLDEVDAPLDDVNVGRFAGKIAEMSQRTQFIIITHNKNTIQIAGALHGVTMEEPGVSKLVSVKLQ
jgi:chromosome segregation protein